MKIKFLVENEGFAQLYPKMVQLKLLAPDGKMRETDTANTETVFRIIEERGSSQVNARTLGASDHSGLYPGHPLYTHSYFH